jgi:BlaI family penicillinase repressor|uniref:BlaI/MecI/CopY family transcriptional regulator n=1 Tax=Roseburia faecis TaxID=301302 RepID=UPI004024D4CD
MTIGDSEIKVMQILWNTPEQALQAKEISSIANKMYNWNKNTTYTLIKRCIQKQAISREDPNFICHALITKEEIQAQEVEKLTNKLFDGSSELLFSSLLSNKGLSNDKIEALKTLIKTFK